MGGEEGGGEGGEEREGERDREREREGVFCVCLCVCVCEVGGGGGVFPSCLVECMSCARERDVKNNNVFYNLIMFCRNQSRRPGRL